ncbi:hypothetical protein, partial [Streptococcus suis]|uniref:hypothetical protein n=1 Tax=Streptococcus suis TaxID=1307 RepID=UPI002412732F
LYQEKEMEAQSLVSHQHSWWFSCFSLREKLARSHNKKKAKFFVNLAFVVVWSLGRCQLASL